MAIDAPPVPPWLLSSIEAFHGSNVLRLAVPFALFTTLLLVAKGPRALRLSDETLRSVTATLTILLINGALARWLVLRVDLTASPYEAIGLPHVSNTLSSELWARIPWPATILLVVLAIDVADYWTHRLMHNSVLWGVHAVHHSDTRMTWLTSFRVHVFETSIMKLGYVAILGWIGLPLWALGAANLVAYLHNRYVHCDLGWNHGPLAKVIASPNWHRWHHSVDPSAHNTNYANIFSFLDVAFGTYRNPGPCTTEVGLGGPAAPGIVDQLLLPFSHLAKTAATRLRRRQSATIN